MKMTRLLLPSAVLALAVSPAFADTFTYTLDDAAGISTGSLSATATGNPGEFLVSSITGSFDGVTISALLAPSSFPVNDSPNDNLLETAGGPLVDFNGIAFQLSNTLNVDIYSLGGYHSISSFTDVDTDDSPSSVESFLVTPAVASTPEPQSLTLLGTGALGLLAAARRRFRA